MYVAQKFMAIKSLVYSNWNNPQTGLVPVGKYINLNIFHFHGMK
jgi:hypothetical protein